MVGVNEEETGDRVAWKLRTRMADPKSLPLGNEDKENKIEVRQDKIKMSIYSSQYSSDSWNFVTIVLKLRSVYTCLKIYRFSVRLNNSYKL